MSDNILVKKPWRNGLAPPDHPSRKVLKTRKDAPKSAEEKIQRRIAVAKRSGKLDLASDAVKKTNIDTESNQSLSDVSSNGASERLIDRIPGQSEGGGQDEDNFLMAEDTKENTSEKTTGGDDLSSSLDRASVYFILSSIPVNAFRIKGLMELWLCHNMLGDAGESIRSQQRSHISLSRIGELNNLTVLSLQDNDISILPESFGNLENLQRLYVQKNKLTELPSSLNKLQKLTDLNASYNCFTTVPPAIFAMSGLSLLDLSNNSGMLDIPDALRKCKSIAFLDISGIPFPSSPSVLSSLSWMFISIDNLRPPSRGSYYGANCLSYEPDYEEEGEFLDFIKSRVKASAAKKQDSKQGTAAKSSKKGALSK